VLGFKRTIDEVAALKLKPEVRKLFLRGNALRVFGIAE
jgi:predicted TIM-barrel fold metal-dependent hydrolase